MQPILMTIETKANQPDQDMYVNEDIFKLCAAIFVAVLIMLFLLFILKQLLEHRLKEKILEKGVSDELASSILNTKTMDIQYQNSRWFMVLMALAAGLTIDYYTRPLGIHSLAIMVFCLAFGFLAHYLFIKYSTR